MGGVLAELVVLSLVPGSVTAVSAHNAPESGFVPCIAVARPEAAGQAGHMHRHGPEGYRSPDQPFGVFVAVDVAVAVGVAVPGTAVRVVGAAGAVGATGDFFG
jgi:hypothetical protein